MKEKLLKMIVSFFIVMLSCTLVARGAASLTVAKVETDKIRKGTLVQRFDGEGTLMAKDKEFQSLPEGQKVARILADMGSEIKAGQGIVQLDQEYLDERIREQEREIEKLKLALGQQELEEKADARTPATAQAGISLDAAKRALDAAEEEYRKVQDAYENCPEDAGVSSNSDLEREEDGTEGLKDTGKKQALKEQMDAADQMVQEAKEAYRQAQDAYVLAEQEEENTRANEAVRSQISQLGQKSTKTELEGLEEDMKKLQEIKDAEGIVTAGADGILESVGAVEGAITTGTEQIVLETGGMEACGVVPTEKIGSITAGDEIEVRIQGETKPFTLEIERMGKNSEGNTCWYAVVEKEERRAGTTLTYEYSKKSKNSYDSMVPISALRESGGVTFVLIAEMRSGILGDSYTAAAVPVTVLEKDENNAAVQTSLPEDALIIVGSNKYVKEGDRVRLSE